jgi:hypothetical protein
MLARGSARQLPLERDRDFRWRRIVVDGPEPRNGRTLEGMAVAVSRRKGHVRPVLGARDRPSERAR